MLISMAPIVLLSIAPTLIGKIAIVKDVMMVWISYALPNLIFQSFSHGFHRFAQNQLARFMGRLIVSFDCVQLNQNL
jgi:hypothetical protein